MPWLAKWLLDIEARVLTMLVAEESEATSNDVANYEIAARWRKIEDDRRLTVEESLTLGISDLRGQIQIHTHSAGTLTWTRAGVKRASVGYLVTRDKSVSEKVGVAANVVTPKPKRSTERGEGREKCIAALTQRHDYQSGSCLNTEAIGSNELASWLG